MCVQELVSEKLRTQQMNNDLEKLTHELEKIGLNKERLLHDESSDDRYRCSQTQTDVTVFMSLCWVLKCFSQEHK